MHAMLTLHTLIRLHSPVILCLHSVGAGVDAMPSSTFLALLEGLLERGTRFLTADEATGAGVLRRHSVLLTFDDGRQDNFDVVLPILRRYSIAATFYVCPGLAGKRVAFPSHPDRDDAASARLNFDMMGWKELRELRSADMCIGSHSAHHVDLTQCPDSGLDQEIAGSRDTLERELGSPIRHFSYPWGRFDARVVRRVRAAGYRTAVAVSVNPLAPIRPWNAFTMARVTAHPATQPAELFDLIGFPNMLRRTLSHVRPARLASGRAA
jgi:peptidoglycan/xylan/chitin deacetylase (PgdA/CDA1 family)